ncbi:MAG: 3'(2'),5'-bisphosphate nucleotidase CysQ [Alistipes sp.]|nr:3'(2'),5'-bisphosphate nucleotidase CysQ [Alistipes sp.]
MTQDIRAYLITRAVNAAVQAGAEIMRIYKHDDYNVSMKSDSTPITVADRLAHTRIKESLGDTCIPILSEEGREMLYDERRNWEMFWLVDPLDGTVEFIKGNNEFTVNIALIQDGQCVGSVVYVPYYKKMYVAERGRGSHLVTDIEPSDDADYDYGQLSSLWQRLPLSSGERHPRIALSRSHQTPETHERVEALRAVYPEAEIVEQGSSYKFCMLAEGVVDYYLRTSKTYEWDTAAGELVLSEAGGSTLSLEDGLPFRYNKEDLSNPWFECRSCDCRIK